MTRAPSKKVPLQAHGSRHAQGTRVDPDAAIAAVEAVLRESLEATRSLLIATRRHRSAIAQADARSMGEAVRLQGELVERLTLLDGRRREALARWSNDAAGATLGTIVSSLEKDGRTARAETLRALGQDIRSNAEELRREQASVRMACQMLLAHGEGLVEQVRRRLSHARTYSRRGGMHVGQPVVSGLDLVR